MLRPDEDCSTHILIALLGTGGTGRKDKVAFALNLILYWPCSSREKGGIGGVGGGVRRRHVAETNRVALVHPVVCPCPGVVQERKHRRSAFSFA
jgi:hypothetical protein